jgi:hypothetical protein
MPRNYNESRHFGKNVIGCTLRLTVNSKLLEQLVTVSFQNKCVSGGFQILSREIDVIGLFIEMKKHVLLFC